MIECWFDLSRLGHSTVSCKHFCQLNFNFIHLHCELSCGRCVDVIEVKLNLMKWNLVVGQSLKGDAVVLDNINWVLIWIFYQRAWLIHSYQRGVFRIAWVSHTVRLSLCLFVSMLFRSPVIAIERRNVQFDLYPTHEACQPKSQHLLPLSF